MADTLFKAEPARMFENYELPAADYHADPALGSTDLELFRDSRRAFYGAKVAPDAKPMDSTPAMDFGSVIHLMLLEPSKVADAVAEPYPEVAPDGKKWLRRKGSDHEKWWAEEEEKRKGKLAFTQDDWDRANATVESVKENKQAMKFLEREGKPEFSIFWTDRDTGFRLKCRVDWMSSVALDIKTTCDPSPRAYASQIARMGYIRKKAHYEAGLLALYGNNAPRFAHIAIETQEPFRIACYEIDDRTKDGLSLGRLQRRATLAALKDCYETGDWREPWEKRPQMLAMPSYVFYEDEYTYA